MKGHAVSHTYISDDMRDAVGRVYERLVSFPISRSDIRRWVIATYFPEAPPRQYWDEDYAKRTRYGGIVAPHEFNPFAWIAKEPQRIPPKADAVHINGVEMALGISGPNVTNGLNGGLESEYGEARMRPGDVITSETAVESYREKTGRHGLMLMTRLVSTWMNQDGALVKHAYATVIRY
jgi:hypothetical protein